MRPSKKCLRMPISRLSSAMTFSATKRVAQVKAMSAVSFDRRDEANARVVASGLQEPSRRRSLQNRKSTLCYACAALTARSPVGYGGGEVFDCTSQAERRKQASCLQVQQPARDRLAPLLDSRLLQAVLCFSGGRRASKSALQLHQLAAAFASPGLPRGIVSVNDFVARVPLRGCAGLLAPDQTRWSAPPPAFSCSRRCRPLRKNWRRRFWPDLGGLNSL